MAIFWDWEDSFSDKKEKLLKICYYYVLHGATTGPDLGTEISGLPAVAVCVVT